jgi:hypothetical protein
MLTLKRASKYRPSGEWDYEDFDVFDGDRCIGRIMHTRPFHGKVESGIPKSRGSKLKSISRTAAARGHQFLSQGDFPARVRCISRQRRIWST